MRTADQDVHIPEDILIISFHLYVTANDTENGILVLLPCSVHHLSGLTAGNVGYRAAVYDVDVSLLTPPYLFILLGKLLGIPVGFIVIYLASKVTYRKLHLNHPRRLLR